MEDTVAFRTQKVFISVSFSIASYKQEPCKSPFVFRREPTNENKQFK